MTMSADSGVRGQTEAIRSVVSGSKEMRYWGLVGIHTLRAAGTAVEIRTSAAAVFRPRPKKSRWSLLGRWWQGWQNRQWRVCCYDRAILPFSDPMPSVALSIRVG